MIELNKEEILRITEKRDIKFVQMQFMDILGIVKSVSLPVSQLEHALDEGVLFDGSSILGYATIDESDMRAHPDMNTFQILPWSDGKLKTARMICDIYDSNGRRFAGDPRYVLHRALDKARRMGYVFNTGPEFEFFLFKIDDGGKPTNIPVDPGRYFDLMPMDESERVRKEVALMLDSLGFDVEATHHEVAPGQHEIDLRYSDALTSADRILTLKHAVKNVAKMHGLHATFMPKPVYGENGNGMHIHQSLFTLEGENAFYDPDGDKELSDVARHYIGGLLKYAKENCAILASWVNSYKRLVPGYEAPVYISWAFHNRSALIRIPAGRGRRTRAEVRNPDPAGNPYLQFAVLLQAGLKGIQEEIEPPKPVEKDLFRMDSKTREKLGIESLPESLGHALNIMEDSEFMKEALGEHIFRHFLHIKRKEWEDYRSQVTAWELENLLGVL